MVSFSCNSCHNAGLIVILLLECVCRGIPGASIFVCGSYCGARAGWLYVCYWLLADGRFIVA
ncbi:hypothetical protein ANAPH1_00417 [Anaplasma phagocytophilum]|nr:hypothetical protein ANAPH1_00417 [Anaplasma phagocytophilum]SCV65639.1 hypothetical protein ANAPH2_01332 [Anaplasma phagocytophilum]